LGSISVEMLLFTPLLMLLAFGIVQLSLYIAANERLEHASHVGCRVAAQGGNKDDIERAVHKCLEHSRCGDAEVEVTESDSQSQVNSANNLNGAFAPNGQQGSFADQGGNDSGDGRDNRHCRSDTVRVCVRCKASKALPGPLIIFSCKDTWLMGCCVMRKE